MDKRKKNGGPRPGAGRKKNEQKADKKITFVPSKEAMEIYNSWKKKSETLDKAIIKFGKQE